MVYGGASNLAIGESLSSFFENHLAIVYFSKIFRLENTVEKGLFAKAYKGLSVLDTDSDPCIALQ